MAANSGTTYYNVLNVNKMKLYKVQQLCVVYVEGILNSPCSVVDLIKRLAIL